MDATQHVGGSVIAMPQGLQSPAGTAGASFLLMNAIMGEPEWLIRALVYNIPIELTPEREACLFELGKTRRIRVPVIITRPIAEWWTLKEGKNNDNRDARAKHRKEMADVFRDGEYQYTHQGVGFYVTGTFADGQHRFLGYLDSKVETPFVIDVTWGLPLEAKDAIDSGILKRSSGDVRLLNIPIDERVYTSGSVEARISAAANALHYLLTGISADPSNSRRESVVAEFREHLEWSARLKRDKVVGCASVLAALTLARKTNPDKIEEYAKSLMNQTDMAHGSPLYSMYQVLKKYGAGKQTENKNRISTTDRRNVSLKVLNTCMQYLEGVKQVSSAKTSEAAFHYFAKAHLKTLVKMGEYYAVAKKH